MIRGRTRLMRGCLKGIGLSLVAGSLAGSLKAQIGPAQNAQANRAITVTRSQHLRIPLASDLLRIAVGDPDILSVETIGSRELLALGKGSGRTTMIVWFRDGTIDDYLVTVQRDLSILQAALHRIHPAIEAEIAPDREAIILTGTVPDAAYSQIAEAIARNYLQAGQGQQAGVGRVFIGAEPAAAPAAAPAPVEQQQPGQPGAPAQPGGQTPAQPATPQAPPALPPSGTVINLIQLENLPATPEEKIRQAIQGIGGVNVTIRRILKGPVRDDTRDVLVLEGSVPNQVALVRILTLASQIFVGQTVAQEDIRVIGDEAGSLATGQAGQGGQGGGVGGGGFGGGAGFGGGGAGGGGNLQNQVRRNIARAKVLEIGGGRILSFLAVSDLPQVRVSARIYEISRSRLRTFNPNTAVIVSDFSQGALNPAGAAQAVQGGTAARVGGGGNTAVQNVLAFLGGSASNELQLVSGHFAIDSVLSYLERVGIARSLSTPSLTVLSGEQALFQVGGEVPVPEAFVAFGGGTTTATGVAPGVFNSVTFVSFGIQLSIRPMVGDDDTITLDVQPQVVQPNTELTSSIRQATGTNPATTAFQTRSLRTSARLQDGQALLMAGLLTRDTNNTQSSTPGLRSIPGIGWLFHDFQNSDATTELVLVINPAVLRDPVPAVQLWQYPDADELLPGLGKVPDVQQGSNVPHVQ
jgi:pilus assembly protein CpaC